MRDKTKSFIAGILCTLLAISLSPYVSAAVYNTMEIMYDDIKIFVNGTKIEPKDVNGNAVEPFISNGTTYLPVRAVAAALGKEVSWDGETNTVYIGHKPNSTKYSRLNPAPIGVEQIIKVENSYQNYTLKFQVTEVIRGEKAWNMIVEHDLYLDPAPEEKEYILVKVKGTVLEIADDERYFFDEGIFDIYSEDFSEYTYRYRYYGDFYPFFGGRAFEGGSVEGYAAYLISKDDSSPTLVYEDSFGNSNRLWFSLTD